MRKMDWDDSVENHKRRRALSPFSMLDADARLFFDRMVTVRRNDAFVFIHKQRAKHR